MHKGVNKKRKTTLLSSSSSSSFRKRPGNTDRSVYVSVRQSQQRIVAAKLCLHGVRVQLEQQAWTDNPSHTCRKGYCTPENEPDLILAGVLQGPPLTNNVWVCHKGVTHVCSSATCRLAMATRHGTIVCPLSGQVMGQEHRPEQRASDTWTPHWKPLAKALQPKIRTLEQVRADRQHALTKSNVSTPETRAANVIKNLPKRQDVQRRAEKVVALLLYNRVRRQQNLAHQKACREHAERAISVYRSNQRARNQLPCIITMITLTNNAWAEPLPFVELKRDENVIRLYAAIVTQIWDRVLRFMLMPWQQGGRRIMLFDQGIRPNVDHVILGTLYLMREGYMPNNIPLLPRDPMLAHHLPLQKDLPLFDFPKRSVTPGKNMLRDMYNRALKHHVPVHLLQLDFDALHQYGYGLSPQERAAQQAANHVVRHTLSARYHACTTCRQKFDTTEALHQHFCW